jgi:hypothetical protein
MLAIAPQGQDPKREEGGRRKKRRGRAKGSPFTRKTKTSDISSSTKVGLSLAKIVNER